MVGPSSVECAAPLRSDRPAREHDRGGPRAACHARRGQPTGPEPRTVPGDVTVRATDARPAPDPPGSPAGRRRPGRARSDRCGSPADLTSHTHRTAHPLVRAHPPDAMAHSPAPRSGRERAGRRRPPVRRPVARSSSSGTTSTSRSAETTSRSPRGRAGPACSGSGSDRSVGPISRPPDRQPPASRR